MSCFTIAFQPTKRSIRTSDGRRSFGAIFFLINDWLRLIVLPFWLAARDNEVAREIVAPSFCMTTGFYSSIALCVLCAVEGGNSSLKDMGWVRVEYQTQQ